MYTRARSGARRWPEKNANAEDTRAQIQGELRRVLTETAALTSTLQRQLDELRDKGWNATR